MASMEKDPPALAMCNSSAVGGGWEENNVCVSFTMK